MKGEQCHTRELHNFFQGFLFFFVNRTHQPTSCAACSVCACVVGGGGQKTQDAGGGMGQLRAENQNDLSSLLGTGGLGGL